MERRAGKSGWLAIIYMHGSWPQNLMEEVGSLLSILVEVGRSSLGFTGENFGRFPVSKLQRHFISQIANNHESCLTFFLMLRGHTKYLSKYIGK